MAIIPKIQKALYLAYPYNWSKYSYPLKYLQIYRVSH